MKLSRLALAVTLLPLSSFYATADNAEDALKLSDTVITANRVAEARSNSTAAVTVFTRDDIDRLQPVNVADLLSRVPGVQIQQSGGRGSQTGVFIRGTSNARSVVLVDGIRVGSVTMGGANGALEHLNIDQIERIEVLRGARSSMYGSDAIGGVIQVFTRRGSSEGIQGRMRAAAGNKGVWERSVGVSGGNQDTRFNLSASLDEMKGIDRTNKSFDSDADRDAYRNKSVSFSLSHVFNEQLKAGVNVLEQRGKTEIDNPDGRYQDWPLPVEQTEQYTEFSGSSASTFVELQATEQWLSRLEVGHSEDKISTYDKLFPASRAINSYRDSAAWLNTVRVGEQHTLRTGVDYLKEKVRIGSNPAEPKYEKDSRWNQAAFVQHSYKGEWFGTELGLRHDKNQQFGNENTWNAALSLPAGQANEFILSYSEGFRAGSLSDIYGPATWGSNPDLRPEKSKSYELQWRSQLTDTVVLETSLYRSEIRDLIVSKDFVMQNVDRARVNGFESSLQHEVFGAHGALNVSFVDARDRKTGRQLNRVAKRTLSYDLDKQLGAFSVGGTWRLVSDSTDEVYNSNTFKTEREKIAGFGTMDLRGSWQAMQDLSLDLRLVNIFDKKYSRALYSYDGKNYGYREDRFTVLLGATWTPNL